MSNPKIKKIIVLASIIFSLVLIFLIFNNFMKNEQVVGNVDLDEINNYSKNVNEKFNIDNIMFEVTDIYYEEVNNALNIIFDISIKNNTKEIIKYNKDNFVLFDELNTLYYADKPDFEIQPNSKQEIKLIYLVPERTLPYILYYLRITKNQDKAIITYNKSFR